MVRCTLNERVKQLLIKVLSILIMSKFRGDVMGIAVVQYTLDHHLIHSLLIVADFKIIAFIHLMITMVERLLVALFM